MYFGITMIVCNLMYTLLIGYIFFSKRRLNIIETKLYEVLIIINIIDLILELLCCFTVFNINKLPIWFVNIINRSFLLVIFSWFLLFTTYIYIISFKNAKNARLSFNNKKYYLLLLPIFILTLLLIFLPLSYYNYNNIVYSYGIAPSLLYVIVLCCFISWIFCFFKKKNEVQKRKFIPVLAFIIVMAIALMIRAINPGFLIISSALAIITNLMYFTIENPDVKMLEQVEIAKEQAERANRAKTDFLSSMSHEIRTPLNAIVGFSESLKEENLPPSAIEEVNDIIEASQTLLDTVNGILDISKIEANKIEIINTNYEFKKVFDELVALSKARLGEDRPIEFRYSMADDMPKYLYGDYARVKQVVLNFLTNAIKYTKEGYIDFNVSNITNNGICRLIIKVEDSGIGIKKESINKLFDKFERLDNENSTIEGTGLGLAITKKLVELMHGKIIVQSIYGKGSQFMVIIDQKVVDSPAIEVIDKDVEKELPNDLSNKKVLIVDDNKLNLKVAARLLKSYNLQIEEVESGFECLDLIGGGNTYDLILMDDMMPKMSGKETFKKLKEEPSFNTPVVILTANAISGMKEQYLAEGFNDYLAKPIEKNELNRVIKKYLG